MQASDFKTSDGQFKCLYWESVPACAEWTAEKAETANSHLYKEHTDKVGTDLFKEYRNVVVKPNLSTPCPFPPCEFTAKRGQIITETHLGATHENRCPCGKKLFTYGEAKVRFICLNCVLYKENGVHSRA